MQVDTGHARHQVDAGRDHGGGVDQCRHRRRPGHGVGQPDVEWDLRRLAGGADEQQDAHQAGADRGRRGAGERESGVDVVHLQRAQRAVEQEHAEQETGVADTVDDKGLLAGARVGGVVEPEADQQVTRQPHAFPAHEQHQQRTPQHQQQHEEEEEVEVGEEAPEALVVGHIAHRIDVDDRADAGDDERHHGGEAVEVEGDLELAVADEGPAIGHFDDRRKAAGLQRQQRLHREREGQQRQPAADDGDEALADAVAAQSGGQHAVEQEAQQRQQDDGGEHVDVSL